GTTRPTRPPGRPPPEQPSWAPTRCSDARSGPANRPEGGLGHDPTANGGRRGGAAPGPGPEPDLPPRPAQRPDDPGRPGHPVRLPGGQLPDAPGRTGRTRAGPDRRRGGDRLPPPRPARRGAPRQPR